MSAREISVSQVWPCIHVALFPRLLTCPKVFALSVFCSIAPEWEPIHRLFFPLRATQFCPQSLQYFLSILQNSKFSICCLVFLVFIQEGCSQIKNTVPEGGQTVLSPVLFNSLTRTSRLTNLPG